MKIISIHQPNYIPWLGYFYKISQSHCFVFLDDAQYSNEGMHNYNYIKTQKGLFRLKIPVMQTLGDKISEVKIKDELGWKQKHLDILETNYKGAPFFKKFYPDFKELLWTENQSLSELNIAIIKFICRKLGIICEFIKASELSISSIREKRIIEICQALGANIYYSGTGARIYQSEENFRDHNIELRYSEFLPFKYKQLWNGFIPNVSVIDYLMNCGYDWVNVIKHQKLVEIGNR